ncbi:uncharacterized protein jus isoform X1 [Cloeon dipterum]|uniref:uncharacterized protein jus isoform X1 n=1 Tax=Cloeon dipterum TaxID=197152 RepID=UPI003220583B
MTAIDARQIGSAIVCCLLVQLLISGPHVLVAAADSDTTAVGAEATPPSPTDGLETGGGDKKFGDRCESSSECGVRGGFCDPVKKTCQCKPELQVTNHIDRCGKEAIVNESCYFNEQCENVLYNTECRDNRCVCRFEMTAVFNSDGSIKCVSKPEAPRDEPHVDPAMIGVLVGLGLMFVIMCVVLRLFSKARWRGENRTIFNTPNPRLMNVSLLDSKLLHGGNLERRASRGSVRGAPSRHASMTSLRPANSPTGSRRGSGGSNGSTPKSPKEKKIAEEHVDTNHHPVGTVTVEMTPPTQPNQPEKQEV